MGAMGTGWRKSTLVPALRYPVLLMGLGQAARALRQPSEASTPSESIAPDSASARAPPGSTSREARRGVANLTGECPRRARARQLHRGPRTRPPLARPGNTGCAVGPRWRRTRAPRASGQASGQASDKPRSSSASLGQAYLKPPSSLPQAYLKPRASYLKPRGEGLTEA